MGLTNWQRYDIILLSTGVDLKIWKKEQEMIGGSLRTMEALRDQRFPEIRQGEQRNPTVPSTIGRQRFVGHGRQG
jgi:hypothetical protein